MEELNNYSFQVDSNIIQELRNLDNYKVIYEKTELSEPNVCAVYFSSNYIYFPNTESSVKKSIQEKDRYEWWNLKYPAASKHIFIRDIYKQWYLHGINSSINSIEKMCDLLKTEIKGYETVFIGSSAGGFAAVLIGSMLHVDKVYAFNNQFFLTDLFEKSDPKTDPLIFREKENPEINKYYDISPFIKNSENIYYFHSNKSDWDIRQYKSVKDLSLNVISINTSIHGIPLLKNNLIELFKLNDAELKNLTNKKLNPIGFSFKIVGIKQTTMFMFHMIPNAYMRFLHNPIRRIFRKSN